MPNESPNSFVARVYDTLHQEWRPLYQAPDSTDAVQGDVYLSDSVNSTLNAATGMTAATPAAVKAANDNANSRIPNTAGSVTNNNLAANSVTTDKIKDGTILGQDLASGTITGDKIANKTITNDKLADNSVSSSNIIDGTIVNADLADKTITGNKIANNSITTDHITNGTILMEDLSEELQTLINEGGDIEISVTPNRAVISDSTGTGIISSSVTSTELGYLSGVTSSVQTQLNNKAPLNHTHNYAGASTPGGPATSADKLTTAHTIQTNLGSTSAVSFNGTANVTPGITGTLALEHGGTGATSARGAEYNIMSQIRAESNAPVDADMMVFKSTAPTATNGATYTRTFSAVCDAVKNKIGIGNYLPLKGGTLTGPLYITSSNLNPPGSNPSSSQYGNQISFNDKNGTRIGFVRANHVTNDKMGLEFMVSRVLNGATSYAGWTMYIDGNNNYYVTPSNDSFINAWKKGFKISNADIRDFVYPVGSYYISNNSTSPAERFGGEWLEVGDDNSEQGFFLYAHHGNKTGGTTRHRHIMNTGKAVNDSQYIMDFDNPNTFLASAVLGRSDTYKEVTFNGAMQYAGNNKPGASGFSMETGPGTSKMSRIRLDMTSEPVINVADGGQKEYNYEFLPGQPYESGEVLPPYREVFAWIRTK